MIDFPTDVAPPDVVSTTTILARPFIEPDAARATSTPSRCDAKSAGGRQGGYGSSCGRDDLPPRAHRRGGLCHAGGSSLDVRRRSSRGDEENQLRRISVSARGHTSGDLALSPVHTQLS